MKGSVITSRDEWPIEIDARDRRAFERLARQDIPTLPTGTLRDIAAAMPETYLAWLAWHASKRDGRTDVTFAAFEAELLEVKGDGEAAELPDPTQQAVTGA